MTDEERRELLLHGHSAGEIEAEPNLDPLPESAVVITFADAVRFIDRDAIPLFREMGFSEERLARLKNEAVLVIQVELERKMIGGE